MAGISFGGSRARMAVGLQADTWKRAGRSNLVGQSLPKAGANTKQEVLGNDRCGWMASQRGEPIQAAPSYDKLG